MGCRAVQKCLSVIEGAWFEIMTTRVEMTPIEFAEQIAKMERRYGITYSGEEGGFLSSAIEVLSDPSSTNAQRNWYLKAVYPKELRKAMKRCSGALTSLIGFSAWAKEDVLAFLADKNKSESLRSFLEERLFTAPIKSNDCAWGA